MITHKIPFKSRIIPTENNFTAPFTGVYNFGLVAGNSRQTVFNFEPNTVYFLDNFSIAGNISSEDFLSAISTVPTLTLSKTSDRPGSTIYTRSFPISQFFQGKECTCFVESNRGNDSLVVSLDGILAQVPNLVGVSPVKLTVSFSVFAMDEKEYNITYRDRYYGKA
jgi:hypothetical protein